MATNITPGQALRDYRESQGLTQDDLAAQLGVTKAFVSAVERGAKSPSLDWLHATAIRLEIDPGSLDPRLASTVK